MYAAAFKDCFALILVFILGSLSNCWVFSNHHRNSIYLVLIFEAYIFNTLYNSGTA